MVDIRMQGPARNALGERLMGDILERLRQAKGEPVLLTGTADAFCAGLNLREVAALDRDGMVRFLSQLEELMVTLYQYPGPTVAAVSGHAIAGGCVLTLCCDWRVITPNPKTKIGLNEVALGLRFPPRTLEICRRRAPQAHHEEVFLGAGLFDPQRALALGLVDEIADDVEAAARRRLEAFAKHPASAYAGTKRDLRGASGSDLVDQTAWARRLSDLGPEWTHRALRERLAAALAR